MTILYLEDEDFDAFFFEGALYRLGFEGIYRRVRNGAEGQRYLRGEGPYAERFRYPLPALIVCDLRMPVLDGGEFIRWLRAQGRFGGLEVVALSCSDLVAEQAQAQAAGANRCLVKPYSVPGWQMLVEEILRGTGALHAVESAAGKAERRSPELVR